MKRLSIVVAGVCLLVVNLPAAQAATTCFGKTPTITGTPGDDIINGTPKADVIAAGSGFDYITGGGGSDLICGGDQGDSIYGNRGNDRLAGQGGTDQLQGGAGSDVMKGGGQVFADFAGGDAVTYADASARVTVNLVTGKGGPVGQDQDTLSGFSSISGSAFDDTLIAADNNHGNRIIGFGGDDTIFGNDAAHSPGDALSGDEGNDQVYAGDGPDVVDGGPGDDVLRGGGDSSGVGDTVSYDVATTAVQVDLGTDSATGEGTDTLLGFRNVVGSQFGDSLTGDGAANTIRGQFGDDTLNVRDGVGGNDTADGGDGVDTCTYDPGDIVTSCP